MIITGTGHRPKSCPCLYMPNHPWLTALKAKLHQTLADFTDEDVIIRSGGAIGWDTWLAEIAMELDIKVHLYIPFPDFYKKWPTESQEKHLEIKEYASYIVYAEHEYKHYAYKKRNLMMLNGSDLIFALLDPTKKNGGTYHMIENAKAVDVPIINFWS